MTDPRVLTARNEEVGPLLKTLEGYGAPTHCLAAPEWLSVLAKAYGVETVLFHLREADGRRIAGQLPTYYGKGGKTLYGLRYGLRARTAQQAEALLESAEDFARANGLAKIDLGLEAGTLLPQADVTTAASFTFDLTGCRGEDDLWPLLSQSGRRGLRAALRSDQSPRSGWEHFDAAFRLYREAMEPKGVRVHSETFLRAIAEGFPDSFVPLVCYEEETPVASAFLLLGERVGAYLYGGTTARGTALRSATLLYFTMMKLCQEHGLACFDAGESAQGSGTFEFKRRLGGRQTGVCYLRKAVGGQGNLGSAAARQVSRLTVGLARAAAKGPLSALVPRGGGQNITARRII
ncbi:GNAT family N-acetyltransferase [Pelagibius sp.]|uniref:GNAT family N-acetyltransferase n=1 Tax=Pelagibius sp. TaxID=1931238 RepID=UPI00262875D1|nr:GNAT family N-acetyltransferase [Pelagibius sp.]